MTADQCPTGTVARVRVGEWEGRALRKVRGWSLSRSLGDYVGDRNPDYTVTVLHVELPAPVEEPKAFGARVEAEWDGERDLLVRTGYEFGPWLTRGGHRFDWSQITNPVVLHDPEATS